MEVINARTRETRSRFSAAAWFQPAGNAAILGQGGIGSWLTLFLARVGILSLDTYDFDIFETHNLSGQLLSKHFLGKIKVKAVAHTVNELVEDANIIPINARITENTDLSKYSYIFSCFDNMEARKIAFNEAKRSRKCKLFIDGRLLPEQYQILTVNMSNLEEVTAYERDFLFSDDEVEELDCSLKQTSHVAAMIASHMTSIFLNFVSKKQQPFRSVPFFIENMLIINYQNKEKHGTST